MNKIVLIFLLLLSAIYAYPAAPSLRAHVEPDIIGIQEQASVVLDLDQEASSFNPPKSAQFSLDYSGVSTSFQTTFINGKMSSQSTYSYSFVFTPKQIGNIDIGPIEIKMKNGTVIKSQPLRIGVTKKPRQTRQNSQGMQDPFAQFEDIFRSRQRAPVLFMKLVPRSPVVYQNQQLVLDAILISSEKSAFDFQYSEISPLRTDKATFIDISQTLDNHVEKYGDYYEKIMKRYVVFPIESGSIGIAPPTIVTVTPYGQMQLRCDPVGINSQPVNKEAGIYYVGDLSIKSSISTNEVETGRSFDVKFEMTGNGNLKVLSNPYGDLNLNSIYIPAPLIQNKFIGMANVKAQFLQTVQYTMLAQKPGRLELPPVIIKYYDNSMNPRQIQLSGYSIRVTEKNTALPQETFPLKLMDHPRQYHFLLLNPILLIFLILFLFLPLAGFIYGRHSEKMQSDAGYSRKILANKKLTRYFQEANLFMSQSKYSEFYTALQKGLFYYITDKLSIPAGISYKELLVQMREKNIPEVVISKFAEVYQKCTANAYSGHSDSASIDVILLEAKGIVDKIKQ